MPGFAFQCGVLNGLVAADDFVKRTQRNNDVGHIGRHHHDALGMGGLQGGA